MGFPGEADDARAASSSPGSPRGTQDIGTTTPRAAPRASRTRPHGSTVESPGNPASFEAVCHALAGAFLAVEASRWAYSDLLAAAIETIGPERRFCALAVRAALDAYPRPPVDAPHQLGLVLAASDTLRELHGARAAHGSIRVRTLRVVHARSVPHVDSPLAVDTIPELANALGLTVGRLLWFADLGAWDRRPARDSPLHNLTYEWTSRPGRTPRLLEKPKQLLRGAQRTILDDLLARLPVSDAAHGFVVGRSAVTGAAAHAGQPVVIGADLTSFFARVTRPAVFGVFRSAGIAEPVARVLAAICTNVVPAPVLAAMPPGGSVDERFALRQALSIPHLPQGSPSSPALANLTLRHLDVRLTGLAASVGATYTRYADDITISGGHELAGRADAFVRTLRRIVEEQGHTLNPRKTRVRRQGVRQTVTGIVVNEHTAPVRQDADRLKAILHNCVAHGPSSQNRSGVTDFRSHLEGRVAWITQLHPGRGARLHEMLARIDWSR
jgi:RNA-directed DNA polymerase